MVRFRLVKYPFLAVLFFCTLLLCTSPASAGIQFSETGPDLAVAISGTNEFSPGETLRLAFAIENRGKITYALLRPDTMTPAYLPTTARTLYATLEAGDSPVRIKSDRQIVGELPSGMVKEAVFEIEVPDACRTGNYTLEMLLEYEYMYMAEQDNFDLMTYAFKDVKKTLPVRVEITPDVALEVEDVETESLFAGGIGYVNLSVKNTGLVDATETSLYIVPASIGPVTTVGDGVYIGAFPSGAVAYPRYKVSVSADADASQTYPVLLFARYRDESGVMQESDPVTVGIRFSPKVRFEAVGDPATVEAGSAGTVKVTYRNTGEFPAYQAQARVSVVDPFTSSDDDVYLGTIQPGETADGIFSIKTAGSATIKKYVLDSEIRYTDAENNEYVSDDIEIVIDVQKPDDNMLLFGGAALIVVIVGAGAYLRRKKRKDGGAE